MIKVGAEREISFNPELRYKRQQEYDINNYDSVEFNFDACGTKQVYKNFNFSIFINDYCNADCKFCVAQLRYAHRQQLYNKVKIEDENEYLKRLRFVLETIRPLNPSISITGGEPTLDPRLPKVLKIVDDLNFRKRTITTNGSGLLLKSDGITVIESLLKYNWNHLNMSIVGVNDINNKQIMRFNDEKSYFTTQNLKNVLSIINGTDLHHRLSCLLLKEGVHSVQDILSYVDFYSQFGANNFIFRELMDYSSDAINKEKIAYCDENKVRLNDIWEDFSKYPELVPYLNILGYYYYVEIYKYKNCTIASESANLNQQYIEKAKNPNMVYEMIFHPNGNLCGSWVDSEEILMTY